MKLIPYGRQSIDSSDVKAVVSALKSGWITQGPKVVEFEKALASYCGAKYAVVVSSGTAALHLACLAAGLKKGDEAITSPITFAATSNAVLYAGAKPVFADIDPLTKNINPSEIKKKITSKTKVILPVDFSGLPCDMGAISKIAKKNKLVVIEDAAHALGAKYKSNGKWIRVGSCQHSDMTVFSFHPVKSITTAEGGAIMTNRKDLYEQLCLLRTHGITKDISKFKNRKLEQPLPWYYEMQELGFNYRISDIQCALGVSQLRRLDQFIAKRKKIVAVYQKQFRGNLYFDLPQQQKDFDSAWHLYAICLKGKLVLKRDQILNDLKTQGIGVQVHYIPVYWHPYYQKLGYRRGDCPNAENFYNSEMSLPIFPTMTDLENKRVIKTFLAVMKKHVV